MEVPRLWLVTTSEVRDVPLVWNQATGTYETAGPVEIPSDRSTVSILLVTPDLVRSFGSIEYVGAAL